MIEQPAARQSPQAVAQPMQPSSLQPPAARDATQTGFGPQQPNIPPPAEQLSMESMPPWIRRAHAQAVRHAFGEPDWNYPGVQQHPGFGSSPRPRSTQAASSVYPPNFPQPGEPGYSGAGLSDRRDSVQTAAASNVAQQAISSDAWTNDINAVRNNVRAWNAQLTNALQSTLVLGLGRVTAGGAHLATIERAAWRRWQRDNQRTAQAESKDAAGCAKVLVGRILRLIENEFGPPAGQTLLYSDRLRVMVRYISDYAAIRAALLTEAKHKKEADQTAIRDFTGDPEAYAKEVQGQFWLYCRGPGVASAPSNLQQESASLNDNDGNDAQSPRKRHPEKRKRVHFSPEPELGPSKRPRRGPPGPDDDDETSFPGQAVA